MTAQKNVNSAQVETETTETVVQVPAQEIHHHWHTTNIPARRTPLLEQVYWIILCVCLLWMLIVSIGKNLAEHEDE